MKTIGVLLLAAATSTGDGPYKPHVGGMKFSRAHAVATGPTPPLAPAYYPGMDGAGGPGGLGQSGRRFPNNTSQIYFAEPKEMHIGWQSGPGGGPGGAVYLPDQLTAPARYNFRQGYIYRLKVTNLPGDDPAWTLYPTLEVAPSTPATDAYLTHNPIPVQFTQEDLDQVKAGNFVTKVIYLPDPKYQELAVSGVETLVSTRLEPGIDPILEADRRGTILLIVRVGGINLEADQGQVIAGPGGVVAPGIISAPGGVIAPGTMPITGAPGAFPGVGGAPATAPGGVIAPAPAATTPAPAPAAPAPAATPAPVEGNTPPPPAPGNDSLAPAVESEPAPAPATEKP